MQLWKTQWAAKHEGYSIGYQLANEIVTYAYDIKINLKVRDHTTAEMRAMKRIVKVTRGRGVDGEDALVAKVTARCDFRWRNAPRVGGADIGETIDDLEYKQYLFDILLNRKYCYVWGW